jgi:hypothetical protein
MSMKKEMDMDMEMKKKKGTMMTTINNNMGLMMLIKNRRKVDRFDNLIIRSPKKVATINLTQGGIGHQQVKPPHSIKFHSQIVLTFKMTQI